MYDRELATALHLATEAGALALKYFRSTDFEVEEKADDFGPVTTADRASNTLITEGLSAAFPHDAILAEESVEAFEPRERVWLVDPIDGTREFIAGRDEFSVLIALVVAGEPVLGVIFRPQPRTLAYAVRGQGAFIRREDAAPFRLQASVESKPEALRLLRSRSHDSERVSYARDQLGITQERRLGSYGLKVLEIAAGRGDVYMTLSSKTALWDSGAAQVILHEAGGRITTTLGEAIDYGPGASFFHRDGTCASNGPAHASIIDAIRGARTR